MHACRPALAAALVAVSLAGCGSDEPPPFKTVSQPETTSTSSPTTSSEVTIESAPPLMELLSKLSGPGRAELTSLVQAQEGLRRAGRKVAGTAAATQQIVERLGTGNAAPGGTAPELARLSVALADFAGELTAITTLDTMLPRLSRDLQRRALRLGSSKPAVAAKLLEAKTLADTAIGSLARLKQQILDARTVVREQQRQESLDAQKLHDAVESGGNAAAGAVVTIDDALATGLTALGSAS
jgi:hypothetical protein